MDETYNKDPQISGHEKTSTDKSGKNPVNTPDNQVQDGSGIVQDGHDEKSIDIVESQQEYIDDANNNLKKANADPAGKSI